ncbi:MAG: nucleotidyltransferase domain-containing protein [Candidatus Woesearchaeota archaeon]
MITQEELKLILTWKNNIFQKYTRNELMKLNDKTSKAWMFKALNNLEKNNLIKKTKISNLFLYQLNTINPSSYKLLNQMQILKTEKSTEISKLNKLISSIPYLNYCLILFGSYAKNKQTKESDLDICLITENKEDYKKIIPYIEEIKFEIELDVNYVTKKEFIEMLTNDEENLGKQIDKNEKLIIFNEDIYYQILIEANKHGYRS